MVYWSRIKFVVIMLLRLQCSWWQTSLSPAHPVEGIQFHLPQSSSGGRGIARTCIAVIVISKYVTFSLTHCDLFQSICYVVNKRFFTISYCFRSIETSLLDALWLVNSSTKAYTRRIFSTEVLEVPSIHNASSNTTRMFQCWLWLQDTRGLP